MEEMSRIELLAVFLSLRTLLEENKTEKALEIINELISEAKKNSSYK